MKALFNICWLDRYHIILLVSKVIVTYLYVVNQLFGLKEYFQSKKNKTGKSVVNTRYTARQYVLTPSRLFYNDQKVLPPCVYLDNYLMTTVSWLDGHTKAEPATAIDRHLICWTLTGLEVFTTMVTQVPIKSSPRRDGRLETRRCCL